MAIATVKIDQIEVEDISISPPLFLEKIGQIPAISKLNGIDIRKFSSRY
jgi:hypothetical protein